MGMGRGARNGESRRGKPSMIIILMQSRSAPSASLVGWLSLTQLISWGSVFYLFSLLLEPVEAELGLTRAQSSLAFSLALLAEGLLAWPVGRLIDRGHERAIMTLGSIVLALGLVLHTQVHGLAAFYGVWLLLGTGLAGTLYPPAFAVVIRRYPNDFRRAIIVITFLGGLASTVFMPLIAALIHAWGWRQALWPLAALQLLVCAPLHASVLRNAPPSHHGRSAGRDPALARHLRSRSFLGVGVFIVLLMAVTAAIPAHMVTLLRSYGLSEAWVIAIPAGVGLLQVAGRVLLFVSEQRWDLHRVNRLVPCLVPLGLLLLLIAPWAGPARLAIVAGFVAVYGMGNGMFTIVKGTAVAEYVDRTHAATLNGALGLPTALARAAAPWLLGMMWSPEWGYSVGVAVLLVAAITAIGALVVAQRSAHA